MAAFFYRMAGSPQFTAPSTLSFKDVPRDHPFYKEIEWMRARGITTGWSDGTFRPNDAVNRDAMAAFFYRYAGSPHIRLLRYRRLATCRSATSSTARLRGWPISGLRRVGRWFVPPGSAD